MQCEYANNLWMVNSVGLFAGDGNGDGNGATVASAIERAQFGSEEN